MAELYRTTVHIWTDYDPRDRDARVAGQDADVRWRLELTNLAREADSGDAYCSLMKVEAVEVPDEEEVPDGVLEFFQIGMENES